MKKKNVTGYILMVLATIIFGLEIVLQKKILNDSIRPESITIYRAIFTFIAMTVMNMLNKKDTSKEVLKNKGEAKKYIKNVILMALFFAFNCYTFATGLKLSSATITTFINSVLTTITTVVLLAIFIPKERKNFKSVYTITATIITFVGIMFTNEVFTNKFDASQDFNVGLLFIFISAILWGLYVLFYAKIDERISTIRLSRDVQFFSILVFLIWLFVTKDLSSALLIDKGDILKIFIFSMITDVGTILTYYQAIRRVSGVVTTIFTLSSPVISCICLYFFLNERISTCQLIGCILLFSANILFGIKEIKDEKSKNGA